MTDTTPPESEVDEGGTLFAVYDTAELRYLDGTFPTSKAARDAHADRVKGNASRFEVRKVKG